MSGSSDSEDNSSSMKIRALTLPPRAHAPRERKHARVISAEASPRSSRLLNGQILGGRYRILEKLGSGGMGSVFSAIDTLSGAPVAVKVLRSRALTKEGLRRFRRETETAQLVESANVCRVLATGHDRLAPFLVMELLHGETLKARLRRERSLSVADTMTMALQMLQGLRAIHDAGHLHRDVKPGNTFLVGGPDSTPIVKLIDFGLVRPLAPRPKGDEDSAITGTGVVPGTPAYLSPEQLLGVTDLDERVDVWGTALTVFEVLAGTNPFAADDLETLSKNIVAMPLPDLRKFRADTPLGVSQVLARALAKRRGERIRDATEFRAALVEAWAADRIRGLHRGGGKPPELRTTDDDPTFVPFIGNDPESSE
jgi:serine/threonine-protein kinase